MKFLGKDAGDETLEWKEWEVQAYIATQSHRAELIFAAGMEGASKSKAGGAKAKATGQAAGEPDLRYYFNGAKVVFIELKMPKGKLNDAQEKRIPILRAMGFPVHMVFAKSPADGWEKVKGIIDEEM